MAHPLIDDTKRDTQRDGEVPGEEDEDPDDEEFSDNEYPPTAAAISHRALASHDDMEQWRSLLARACERAREHQPAYVRPPPESFDDGLKALPPALLYRVRVKDGYEETAAMVLANKLLMAGTHFAPSVKSIIGRVSCPGWIFIESDGADASKLCANVSDVYPRHIHPIVEDLQQYLHEPLIAPKEGDWIRLNSPLLYCGNLAYVHAYNNTSADRLTTERKNPGGEGADILVMPWVEWAGLDDPLDNYWDTKRPFDDLAQTQSKSTMTQTQSKPTTTTTTSLSSLTVGRVPTHEELALFQWCSFVDPGDITRAINEIATLPLRVTDRVVVTSGELISMTGTIAQFSGNDKEATIRLDSTEVTMDVVLSPRLLRKVVQVADRVRVVGGAGDGRVGWVVAVDGTELHVWEDKTALLFKVNVNHVAFHHNAQAFAWVVPKQDVSWKPFEENQHPPLRRNLVFLGRHVLVIRRGVFKGYEGIIREILEGDEVRVELSATLRRETFHLLQLSNLNDDKHKALMYKYHPETFQAGMLLPTQPVLIPQSVVPLTPSTPLPGGSSTDIGPAWNPSSRTPNPHLQFSCNPYMDHWRIDLTRKVKVRIHNTKPLLCDPGWKSGDYEGKKGLWKASDTREASIAWVQILVPPTIIRIPEMVGLQSDLEEKAFRAKHNWMIPRLKKKHLMKERPPTPSYTPSARPRNTLPTRGGKIPALIFLQHGQALAQNHYLPPRIHPAADPSLTAHPEEDNPFLDYDHIVDPPISRHHRKREAQWRNWN
ncbi:hypothetical protein DXG01_007124, partial [Tephrocybe rancida]